MTTNATNNNSYAISSNNDEDQMNTKKMALRAEVSLFTNALNPIPIRKEKVSQALTKILKSDDMKRRIENARNILNEKGAKAYSDYKKTNLPAVTFSGVFSKRSNTSITTPTGLLTLDFDHTGSNTDYLLIELKNDEHIVAAFKSPGGDGIKALMHANNIYSDSDHKLFFKAAENYIQEKYKLQIDKSCKDISRLTFLSFDPDIYVAENPKSFKIEEWLPTEETKTGLDHQKIERSSSNHSEYSGKALYAWKIVLSACKRIRESLPGDQHNTRLKESRLVGGYIHHGLDEDHVYEVLEKAVEDSGAEDIKSALKTIRDGINYGIEHPAEIPDTERMTVMTVDDGSKNATVIRKPSNTNGPDGYDGYDGYFENKVVKAIPPVPLNVFHPALRLCMQEISIAKQIPIEICVAAMLAFQSTLVGRSCGLKIKENWIEHGNLYIALVARSGVGKTPATNYIFKPITQLERQYYNQYEEDLKMYQIQYEIWEETKRDKKTQNKYSICKPEHPVRKEIVADDFTIEALTNSLIYNPKGISIIKDEISGLFLLAATTIEPLMAGIMGPPHGHSNGATFWPV